MEHGLEKNVGSASLNITKVKEAKERWHNESVPESIILYRKGIPMREQKSIGQEKPANDKVDAKSLLINCPHKFKQEDIPL